MDIMRGYGMGNNMARLIAHNWGKLMFVPIARRLLGVDFGTGIGVMQGNPASTMIFNTLVDAVVRAVL